MIGRFMSDLETGVSSQCIEKKITESTVFQHSFLPVNLLCKSIIVITNAISDIATIISSKGAQRLLCLPW